MKRTGLVGVLLFSLSACQQPTTYTPVVSSEELAREEAIQQRMVDEAAKRGGVPRPWERRAGITKQFERVAKRVEQAGAKLCQDMGLPAQNMRCYYYFKMANNNDLNAHADGENVVLYSGMMRFLKNDDEVAVVMAHELAHNLMGHVDSQRMNTMGGALMGAVIDGVVASQGISAGGSFSDLGGRVGQRTFSVEFEEEADYVGLYIASLAGYNIGAAPNFWRRFSVEDPRGLFYGYTHPSNAKRAVAIQKTIYEINYKRKHRVPLIPDFKQ